MSRSRSNGEDMMRNYKFQSSNSRLILSQAMAINQNTNTFVNRDTNLL